MTSYNPSILWLVLYPSLATLEWIHVPANSPFHDSIHRASIGRSIPRYFQEPKPKPLPASLKLESDSPCRLGTILSPVRGHSHATPYTVLSLQRVASPLSAATNSTMLHDAPRFRKPEAQVNPSWTRPDDYVLAAVIRGSTAQSF